MTLRRVNRFTNDPQLESQLQAFQEAVRSELEALRGGEPLLVVTNPKTSNYTAKLDELVQFEGNNAFDIFMPEALPSNYGHKIAAVRLSGSSLVRFVPNSCLIGGAATWSLSSVYYMYCFYSTPNGWSRKY